MATQQKHVSSVPHNLKVLLEDYPELRVDSNRGRVCCCLTGHEMPLREDAVRSYVTGKKFLKVQQQREFNFDQYKPHLVPNTKKGLQHILFCTLTLRCVTKRPSDVMRHVNGKRYKRALKRWQMCQETGEKFKPRSGRKKQMGFTDQEDDKAVKKFNKSDDVDVWQTDSDDETDEDEMNDLYPSDDFILTDDGKVNEEVAKKEVANGEVSSDSELNTADTEDGDEAERQSLPKAVKRKKRQRPALKKKRVS